MNQTYNEAHESIVRELFLLILLLLIILALAGCATRRRMSESESTQTVHRTDSTFLSRNLFDSICRTWQLAIDTLDITCPLPYPAESKLPDPSDSNLPYPTESTLRHSTNSTTRHCRIRAINLRASAKSSQTSARRDTACTIIRMDSLAKKTVRKSHARTSNWQLASLVLLLCMSLLLAKTFVKNK